MNALEKLTEIGNWRYCEGEGYLWDGDEEIENVCKEAAAAWLEKYPKDRG